MHRVALQQPDSFEEFRDAARGLLSGDVLPEQVSWQSGGEADLFGEAPSPVTAKPISVPAAYVDLAKDVICHRDEQRNRDREGKQALHRLLPASDLSGRARRATSCRNSADCSIITVNTSTDFTTRFTSGGTPSE